MRIIKIILLAFVAIFAFSSCKGEELGRCDLPKGLQVDLILWNNQNPIRKIIWRGVPECLWLPDEPNKYEGGKYYKWRFEISDHLPYIVKVKLK